MRLLDVFLVCLGLLVLLQASQTPVNHCSELPWLERPLPSRGDSRGAGPPAGPHAYPLSLMLKELSECPFKLLPPSDRLREFRDVPSTRSKFGAVHGRLYRS